MSTETPATNTPPKQPNSKVNKFAPKGPLPIRKHLGVGQIVGLILLAGNLVFGFIYLDGLLKGEENALQQTETLKKSIAIKRKAIQEIENEIKYIEDNGETYEHIVKHRPLKPRKYEDVKAALSTIRKDNFISRATLKKEPKYARIRGSHTIETEIINLELRSFLDSDIFNFAHDATTSIDAILFLDSLHMKRVKFVTNKHIGDIRDGLNGVETRGLVQGKMKLVFRNAVAVDRTLVGRTNSAKSGRR
jgi:hypothetical protein